jgi:hypothetical protein
MLVMKKSNDIIMLEVTCKECKTEHYFEVLEDQWIRIQTGDESIQNILPHFDSDERELLISGICGSCWNKIFGEE